MTASHGDQPQITVAQVGETTGDGPYEMTFAVVNDGADYVRLIEARMPHVVLRADVVDLASHVALAAGASAELTFLVTYEPRKDASEPSNPFVIMRLSWRGDEWRVLAQLAVAHDERGAPTTTTANLTAHRVGFSESL